MLKKLNILVFLSILVGIPISANAQTRFYISDQLEVPIRAGSSDRFKVTKMLKSGLEVQVLEQNAQTGYSLVKANGSQGWILTRYLMKEPSARNYIEEAKKNYEPARLELEDLKSKLSTASELERNLRAEIESLRQDKQAQAEELAKIKQVSAQALIIDSENQKLRVETHEQSVQLNSIKQQYQSIKDDKRSNEWIVGACILFSGLIFGAFILPRLIRFKPRKSSWDLY